MRRMWIPPGRVLKLLRNVSKPFESHQKCRRALLHPREQKRHPGALILYSRRMWDSNPRDRLGSGGLVNRCLQPLGQSSNIFVPQIVALREDWPRVCHTSRIKMKPFIFIPLGQSSNIFVPQIVAPQRLVSCLPRYAVKDETNHP